MTLSAKSPRRRTVSPRQEIVAVLGSDESEIKRRAKELSIVLTPAQGGEFSVDTIDGNADNAEQAVLRIHQTIDAIQTLPFFGGEKLVWLKNINFLSDSITSRAASVQNALEKLMALLEEGAPPGVRILLSAPDIDKRRSFYKSLGKTAKVELFDKIDISRAGWEEDAAAIVQQRAVALGLRFEAEALELFVRLAGADTRQLGNELEKIDLYLGADRRITTAIVRALVAKTAAGVIWEIGNSISKRQLARSLALLDQLLFQGETPIGILYAAIIPTVRNLLIVKDLMDRYHLKAPPVSFQFGSMLAKLPEEATRHLPRKKDGGINAYSLGFAASEAHRFQLGELVVGLEACLGANLQLVSTQLEPKLILSKLLVKLVLPQER